MKNSNRILAVLMVLTLLIGAVPAVLAAATNKDAYPGDGATLKFSYSNVYGLDGSFTLNDPEGIVESWSASNGNTAFLGNVSNSNCFLYSGNATAGTASVNVYVKIKASAQPGQTASVSFNYSVTTDALGTVTDYKTETATVTVKQRVTPVEPEPTTPPPEVKIDYTALERQIAIANGLNEADYTADTWDILVDALTAANNALTKKDQDTVNTAAKNLEQAIAGLVRMDYSGLEAVLKQVQAFLDKEDVSDLWMTLSDAVARANELLTSGDQEAVNAVTDEITQALAQLQAKVEADKVPEVVIQEVEVEVPPTDDFCNIPMHRIWPILFFVSLGVNVLLGGAFFLVLSVRKKKQDSTPLVDYDIDDDFEDVD